MLYSKSKTRPLLFSCWFAIGMTILLIVLMLIKADIISIGFFSPIVIPYAIFALYNIWGIMNLKNNDPLLEVTDDSIIGYNFYGSKVFTCLKDDIEKIWLNESDVPTLMIHTKKKHRVNPFIVFAGSISGTNISKIHSIQLLSENVTKASVEDALGIKLDETVSQQEIYVNKVYKRELAFILSAIWTVVMFIMIDMSKLAFIITFACCFIIAFLISNLTENRYNLSWFSGCTAGIYIAILFRISTFVGRGFKEGRPLLQCLIIYGIGIILVLIFSEICSKIFKRIKHRSI